MELALFVLLRHACDALESTSDPLHLRTRGEDGHVVLELTRGGRPWTPEEERVLRGEDSRESALWVLAEVARRYAGTVALGTAPDGRSRLSLHFPALA